MYTTVPQVSRIVAVNLGIRYNEARKRYAEVVLAGAVRAARHLSAGYGSCAWALWDSLEVHALALVGWALHGAGEEVMPVLQQLAWQAEQLLEARLPRSTWLGACRRL